MSNIENKTEDTVIITASSSNPSKSRQQITLEAKRREDENEKKQAKLARLAQYDTARRQETLMTGIVGSADIDEKLGNAFWVIYDDNVKIFIPYEEALMIQPADIGNANTHKALVSKKNILTNAIGAQVSYIITSMQIDSESGTAVCVGSRVAGLKKERKMYFGPSRVYEIQEGTDVDATILSVGPYAVYITTCGIDKKVRNTDLSFQFHENLKDHFTPGQVIRMRIMKMNLDADIPKLFLSAKPILIREYQENLKLVRPGSRYCATVVSIHANHQGDGIRAHLFVEEAMFPATCVDIKPGILKNICSGTKVIFEVSGKFPNSGIAHGKILRVVSKPQYTHSF